MGSYRFSSGHRVVMVRSREREEVQIRSKEGALQVRIVLTAAGPVVELAQADLELRSLGTVRTVCQRFEVQAESFHLESRGPGTLQTDADLTLTATGEMVAQAAMIRLN